MQQRKIRKVINSKVQEIDIECVRKGIPVLLPYHQLFTTGIIGLQDLLDITLDFTENAHFYLLYCFTTIEDILFC